MPLLAYFGTIGVVLTALLVFANFLLKSPQPEGSGPAAAAVEANLPTPKVTSGVARHTVGVTRVAPSVELRGGRLSPDVPAAAAQAEPTEPATRDLMQPAPEQQMSEGNVERRSLKNAKPRSKTAKTRMRGRNAAVARGPYGKGSPYSSPGSYSPGYYSYAHERPAWPFSAQGTLGPH
jgi:hypothetical protein